MTGREQFSLLYSLAIGQSFPLSRLLRSGPFLLQWTPWFGEVGPSRKAVAWESQAV
jgi:hypothetical protein